MGGRARQLTPEEEKQRIVEISAAAEAQSEVGDVFYLISQRWWHDWLEYVNQSQESTANDESSLEHQGSVHPSALKRPSNIDNSELIDDAGSEDSAMGFELHKALVEGTDYVLLPEDAWTQLHLWYGGGPVLARKVINTGLSQTELTVEVYPLSLQLHLMPKGDSAAIRLSKKSKVSELHQRACEIFNLSPRQVRIWDYYNHHKHALLEDMELSLDVANIQMDQDILVEIVTSYSKGVTGCIQENGSVCNGNAAVPRPQSSYPTSGGLSLKQRSARNGCLELSQSQLNKEDAFGLGSVSIRGSSCGLIGLMNLGNTCFMNSAVQCLVHTPEFAKYFCEDYHREINRQNPLGMVGELAVAFGNLLRRLWQTGRTPISPKEFKAKLVRFAPQFSGSSQQDSQELLAFLLDGLHEDLNRVKHKPYVRTKDADGRPDDEVADEYWANHIARNDSIIVDVCQGQYKSTLACPVCTRVSVTFDPFMYLSLPLQHAATRSMKVTIFTYDGSSLPIAYAVTVSKQGRCVDLIQALSKACFLQPDEKLLLAEIRGHLIYRFLEDPSISLSSIRNEDYLAAYKVPNVMKKPKFLQLIHRLEEQGNGHGKGPHGWKPYGTPLVAPISCDEKITRYDVQQIVQDMLSPMSRANSSAVDLNQSLHKLPLQLVDENNACIDLTVGDDKEIKLSSSSMSILVFVDWSNELMESYDTTHIQNLPEVFKDGQPSKRTRNEPISLYNCLEAFIREEPLVPEDMWFCPKCKERRQASKKLDLWRLPEVLVIHLKRFSYSRSTKHKLEAFVKFPMYDFDLTNYVANHKDTQRYVYELYALTNHYGNMGSGHYTANIKLPGDKWYEFDDGQVSPIEEEDVRTNAAYVLFYRRVNN